jgi:hypothetical protein
MLSAIEAETQYSKDLVIQLRAGDGTDETRRLNLKYAVMESITHAANIPARITWVDLPGTEKLPEVLGTPPPTDLATMLNDSWSGKPRLERLEQSAKLEDNQPTVRKASGGEVDLGAELKSIKNDIDEDTNPSVANKNKLKLPDKDRTKLAELLNRLMLIVPERGKSVVLTDETEKLKLAQSVSELKMMRRNAESGFASEDGSKDFIEISLRPLQSYQHAIPLSLMDYVYFTAYTITTTGYGDIVPTTTYAKFLCTFANIIEVFFLVVFFNALLSVRRDDQRAATGTAGAGGEARE